jgi:glycosyltransferase involved in cell wall biosynthesis
MNLPPTWSVMIPAYHCNAYLPTCLASVLDQCAAAESLQLVVVNDDPDDAACEQVVRAHGRGRADYHHNNRNLGAGGNFNRCLTLATGELILVLHGDCYLLPGFFDRIAALAAIHPDAGMIACRALGVDDQGQTLWESRRYPEFESLTFDDSPIWTELHLMPSAVVVRRKVYTQLGGYREDIANGQDWEMWSRVIHACGIIMTPEILACYRQHADSITGRTKREAQNIREFAKVRPGYPLRQMFRGLGGMAMGQARDFRTLGDHEAVTHNLKAWAEITPLPIRLWSHGKQIVKRIIRRS